MGRLLDEDTVIKVLERWQKAFRENSHYASASDLSLVIKDVRELPTIQPEVLACGNGELVAKPEPQEGHWIGKYPTTHICSECGWLIPDSKVKVFAYCPNCGARMKGERQK